MYVRVMMMSIKVFLIKHKTAYEMRISDWSSDVCSSDLRALRALQRRGRQLQPVEHAALGGRLLALACRRRFRRWALRGRPEAVEHASTRLPLGRGLSRASAAVAGIANRAWIFAHLAHGSRARAKDLHRRAFRPFRQSDLARQSAPVGESTNLRIPVAAIVGRHILRRSEEHTSELQSLMRISYAVFCLKKKNTLLTPDHNTHPPRHPHHYLEA